MRNVLLVIRREFLTRVKKKSFVIRSLLAPFIFALTMFIYFKLISDTSVAVSKVLIADNTQWVGKSIPGNDRFTFENIEPKPVDELRKEYAASDEAIILYIEGEKDEYPLSFSMYSKKSINIDLQEYVKIIITSTIENRKLKEYRIDNLDKILEEIHTVVDMRTIKWEKNKEDRETNTLVIMAISYILAFTLYMFIYVFGSMVMRGVIEEKSNRIIEIMISSVNPFHLMAGKIVGIALVAVLQFFIWIALTAIFFMAFQQFSSGSEGIMSELTVEFASIDISGILVFFLLFFIGGYLLYASMFAAIGSAVDSEADSQQLMMPVTIPLILAMMIMVQTFRYPDSSLSVWASMIPLTSPIIMITRIPFGVPMWQILLSFAILITTFVMMSYISAKIYRVGILMYGKKPSFKEIFKWLKYK
jgi:ABC-2 type transport system permease protein